MSAARPTAPYVAFSAARHAARLEVRRAARLQIRAARRAARVEVRRAARFPMQTARLEAPNVSSAGAVSGNSTPADAAVPGIWGLPVDWTTAPGPAQSKRRRYARASARCAEVRGVRDGAGALSQERRRFFWKNGKPLHVQQSPTVGSNQPICQLEFLRT